MPVLLAEGVAGELAAGLVGEARGTRASSISSIEIADDPEFRHQPRLEEAQQPRQQLAAGEVAGGAEDDDHVRRQRRMLTASRLQRVLAERFGTG